jgi:hypothetical protein
LRRAARSGRVLWWPSDASTRTCAALPLTLPARAEPGPTATSSLMHYGKRHLHSIKSSARASSVGRLDAANRWLVAVKRQLQTGESPSVIGKAIEKVEEVKLRRPRPKWMVIWARRDTLRAKPQAPDPARDWGTRLQLANLERMG